MNGAQTTETGAVQILRGYEFWGMEFKSTGIVHDGDREWVAECPFCGREKFYVNESSGLWRCWVCQEGTDKGGGNLVTFIRLLWKMSDEQTSLDTLGVLTVDRQLLYPETLNFWGVCKSATTGDWIVPGYNAEHKQTQLYKWLPGKPLYPTPGLGHGFHMPMGADFGHSTAFVLEGIWDGAAFWEVARMAGNFLDDAFVIAVPGCGSVGEPFKKWLPIFVGKDVVLMFDSDHPRIHNKRLAPSAGFAAVRRAASLLSRAEAGTKGVYWLKWGENGYDKALPSGYDVRDALGTKSTVAERTEALGSLIKKIAPADSSWDDDRSASSSGRTGLEPEKCESWPELLNSLKKALHVRQSIEDVFAVMLAVAISTDQQGDQLFLQVIGDAGSGKTRLCDAMLVSKNCYALEHLTGFHSGWKDQSGEDFSLISRINGKTLITPEGDVLMSSPRFVELMSQQRRIFDGTSGASFKNRKEDMRYVGLRTPWIMAGTPQLLLTDQSRLGDRFLRAIINHPTEKEKAEILERVGYTAIREVLQASNGDPAGIVEENLRAFYRLTGGYIDYLRMNVGPLLNKIKCDEGRVVEECAMLGEFSALMRSRPDPKSKERETHDTREVPTRLTKQFVRLAMCLTPVLSKMEIDADVMRRVRKVSIDTARGITYRAAKFLYACEVKEGGASVARCARASGHGEDRENTILGFMRQVGIAEWFEHKTSPNMNARTYWRLTKKFRKLWEGVFNAGIEA
jgi:hypothetical protein